MGSPKPVGSLQEDEADTSTFLTATADRNLGTEDFNEMSGWKTWWNDKLVSYANWWYNSDMIYIYIHTHTYVCIYINVNVIWASLQLLTGWWHHFRWKLQSTSIWMNFSWRHQPQKCETFYIQTSLKRTSFPGKLTSLNLVLAFHTKIEKITLYKKCRGSSH